MINCKTSSERKIQEEAMPFRKGLRRRYVVEADRTGIAIATNAREAVMCKSKANQQAGYIENEEGII